VARRSTGGFDGSFHGQTLARGKHGGPWHARCSRVVARVYEGTTEMNRTSFVCVPPPHGAYRVGMCEKSLSCTTWVAFAPLARGGRRFIHGSPR